MTTGYTDGVYYVAFLFYRDMIKLGLRRKIKFTNGEG